MTVIFFKIAPYLIRRDMLKNKLKKTFYPKSFCYMKILGQKKVQTQNRFHIMMVPQTSLTMGACLEKNRLRQILCVKGETDRVVR